MNIKELDKEYVVGTYGRFDLVAASGSGAVCVDADGKEYCPDGGFEFEPAEKKTWEIVGYNYAYTEDGEIVEYITDLEAGEIYGGVEIINYEEEDLSVAVVVAVYENGMLKDVTLVEDDIPIATDSETAKVGGSVTVPEMDPEKEYLMKVMVWDSTTGMMPLAEAAELR